MNGDGLNPFIYFQHINWLKIIILAEAGNVQAVDGGLNIVVTYLHASKNYEKF